MSALSDVDDQLAQARALVECAFMACHILDREHREPLSTTLGIASEKLDAIREKLTELHAGLAVEP